MSRDEELETALIKLTACGVVANANTEKSAQECRIPKDHKYYSASLSDVERAVDREMALRKEIEFLKNKIKGK